jgi:hypothetical protein
MDGSSPLRPRTHRRSFRGLVLSIAVHLLLVFAAGWIVFRQAALQRKQEFVAHAVAGGHAASAGTSVHPVSHPKVRIPRARLATKSASATLALPPMSAPMLGAAIGAGMGRGGAFGRGIGQGAGGGLGAGLGKSAGFVGRPVMGAMIRARRVAVYLDCSGSMKAYLPRVEAEIRKQFPDADVFRFDGARVVGLGDMVVHGRRFHGLAPKLRQGPSQTVLTTLTANGRQVQAKIKTACEQGSLGAWMDRLLSESYDALVVFSDFQDGVRLYEAKKGGAPHLIYSDSSYHRVGTAPKVPTHWQREWLEAFSKAGRGSGPRLYLFTVQQEPQAFLQACVAASGGTSVSVAWLKKAARPPR